ncbi:hypothetical protein HD595_005718 [Nonomuraea roseoviolacea subsp. carminata]|uniref:Uncharacterized protein n=1 Tax=Nonomuraea roseoviolacea subsp. carminata TaxID=160689 RepID=A0ABT1K844_9ACTN|nr:hypothetical protein [Nonomuraea roseoviolacea subsp. carminata]
MRLDVTAQPAQLVTKPGMHVDQLIAERFEALAWRCEALM